MPSDNWLVEEIITPGPELDVRAMYIRLLEQVIDALKEEARIKMGEDVEEEIIPRYSLPTVIFAFLDDQTPIEGYEKGERALAQLYCYRDRREFLKDLTSYGEEDYLQELGLRAFLNRKDQPHTTV